MQKPRIPKQMIQDLLKQDIHINSKGVQRFNGGRTLSETVLMEVLKEYESGGNVESWRKKVLTRYESNGE